MKSDYKLKGYSSVKSSFFKRSKTRVNIIYKLLTSKNFIFFDLKDAKENTKVDIINYNNDHRTTLNTLENYKSILIGRVNHETEINKTIEKWLHTED